MCPFNDQGSMGFYVIDRTLFTQCEGDLGLSHLDPNINRGHLLAKTDATVQFKDQCIRS
jgi:hypothetical protein